MSAIHRATSPFGSAIYYSTLSFHPGSVKIWATLSLLFWGMSFHWPHSRYCNVSHLQNLREQLVIVLYSTPRMHYSTSRGLEPTESHILYLFNCKNFTHPTSSIKNTRFSSAFWRENLIFVADIFRFFISGIWLDSNPESGRTQKRRCYQLIGTIANFSLSYILFIVKHYGSFHPLSHATSLAQFGTHNVLLIFFPLFFANL